MLAFGLHGYFKSWRNVFDLLLAIYSIAYFVFAVTTLAVSFNNFADHADLIVDVS